MKFPRPRDIAQAVGLAATLGANSAGAEQPSVPKIGIENKVIVTVKPEDKTPLNKLVEVMTLGSNKREIDDRVEGFNPNGIHKPVTDLVSGVSEEIHLAEISEAKNIALRLAVDPKSDSEKTAGYIGLKVDL